MTRIPDFNFTFNEDWSVFSPIPCPKLKKRIDRLISKGVYNSYEVPRKLRTLVFIFMITYWNAV